jgi:hypothetical protein
MRLVGPFSALFLIQTRTNISFRGYSQTRYKRHNQIHRNRNSEDILLVQDIRSRMSRPHPSMPLPSIRSSEDNDELQAGISEMGPARATKMGRPNQWTTTRSRKLARVYLYSTLPTKDIGRVLQNDSWPPRFVPPTVRSQVFANFEQQRIHNKDRQLALR